jgi:hypothetical protein
MDETATVTISGEEIEAAFMRMSEIEVRELREHIGRHNGAQCVFVELQDPHTSEAGAVVLSSGRRVWIYATDDDTANSGVSMLVIWKGADCLSVRR